VSELNHDALRRKLAAIEHERWADWQRLMHEQCSRLAGGSLAIPAFLVERWERQIATPFDQLTDAEQQSDLEQVDRYWPLIVAALEEREGLRRLLTASQTLVSRGPQSSAWIPFWDIVAELSDAWKPPAARETEEGSGG